MKRNQALHGHNQPIRQLARLYRAHLSHSPCTTSSLYANSGPTHFLKKFLSPFEEALIHIHRTHHQNQNHPGQPGITEYFPPITYPNVSLFPPRTFLYGVVCFRLILLVPLSIVIQAGSQASGWVLGTDIN
jgi:hypothetical protein